MILNGYFGGTFCNFKLDDPINEISIDFDNEAFYLIAMGKTSIFFTLDPEGELDISIGKCGTSINDWGNYFCLDVLVYFLSNKEERVSIPGVVNFEASSQAKLLSKKLSSYLSQIEVLMNDKNFPIIRKRINSLYKELMEIDRNFIIPENQRIIDNLKINK